MPHRLLTIAVLVVAAFLTIDPTNRVARAQFRRNVTNTYTANFICGVQQTNNINAIVDAQAGRYATKITVHNNTGTTIEFNRKIIMLSGGENTINPQRKSIRFLKPDEAMEIVCKDVFKLLQISFNPRQPTPYIEGLVIFEVIFTERNDIIIPQDPLDVAGVYTFKGDLSGTFLGFFGSSGDSINVVVYPAKSNKHPFP